jgi:hypothetical protein
MSTKPTHPMQPLYLDGRGTIRFHRNGIVVKLLDTGKIDLCAIAQWTHRYPEVTQDDVEQFWQLLGYSVDGYAELSFISDDSVNKANTAANQIMDSLAPEPH